MAFDDVGWMWGSVKAIVMTICAFRDVRHRAVNTVFISNRIVPGAEIV
jgi:hypothetical protein